MLDNYTREEALFKLFNVKENILEESAKKFDELSNGTIKLNYENNFGDLTVRLTGNGSNPENFDRFVKAFLKAFGMHIYADYECTLQESVVQLLKLYKKKVSVAESFTGGSVSASITGIKGASEVFYEGIVCYDTNAKINRLGIARETVRDYSVVSREVAYEMVRGVLMNSFCDVAVATTGYASPTGDANKPCGLCYIGVGDESKIEVFEYNFSGERDEITSMGKNAALFALNRLLKDCAL